MAWPDVGNGIGVFRSGETADTNVNTYQIKTIANSLRSGVLERAKISPYYSEITQLLNDESEIGGAGISFDALKTLINSCQKCIEYLVSGYSLNPGSYVHSAWPISTSTRILNISTLLALGTYGTSWVTFRPTSGAMYDQIYEALNNIAVVSCSTTTAAWMMHQGYAQNKHNSMALPLPQWDSCLAEALSNCSYKYTTNMHILYNNVVVWCSKTEQYGLYQPPYHQIAVIDKMALIERDIYDGYNFDGNITFGLHIPGFNPSLPPGTNTYFKPNLAKISGFFGEKIASTTDFDYYFKIASDSPYWITDIFNEGTGPEYKTCYTRTVTSTMTQPPDGYWSGICLPTLAAYDKGDAWIMKNE